MSQRPPEQPGNQPPFGNQLHYPQQPPFPQQGQGYPPPGYPQQPPYNQPPQGYSPPYGQPVPQPKKKRGKLPLIIGGIIGLLLFACIGAFAVSASHGSTTSTTTTQNTTNATGGATSQPASGKWTTTHTFSGNGSKKTASFNVGDDWKITWSCKGVDIGGTTADAALVMTIYGSDNTPIDVANGTCKAGKTTNDATEEHRGGTVYLDITGDSDWTIQVQELK